MGPPPAIVELGQSIACQEIDKLEVEVGLSEDNEIINLVEQTISNVDSMNSNDDPAEEIPQIGKPSSLKLRMILI